MPARILVIDDEDSMCHFMEIMLSKEGYKVDVTSSARDGVAKVRDENFDLIIADLNMPEMTGIDVLRQVRSFKSDQEFIVMTAFASVDTAIEAMKQGAADYITKPFKVDEIKLVIEKSINRRTLIGENITLKRQLQNDYSRGVGYRQGPGGQGYSLHVASLRRPVCHDQLRRPTGNASRDRTLRPQERGVHRGHSR
jgi:two-component system response regulator PilR (NtrC family)